jgi:hypothetical protein
MPRFSKEVNVDEYVDVDLDIDVDEYFDEMDEDECKEMARLLTKEGYIEADPSTSRSSWEFDEAIIKLKQNYYVLTNEETDLIIKLAKRF